MLKVDLHTHSADDPQDIIPYTTIDLIDRAADLGFGAIAVTLHNQQRDPSDLADYARHLGVELIPGVERTICGRHVLLLNFAAASSESVESFADLAELKQRHPEGLVVAPHPFYPAACCLRGVMDRHVDLFDAVELNAFYTRRFDFNGTAIRWARQYGKPVVANSDVHRLSLLGASFSFVDADPDANAICAAIKAGRVMVHTRPLSVVDAATYFVSLTLSSLRRRRSLPLRLPPHGCGNDDEWEALEKG